MIEESWSQAQSGLLLFGPKAERRFGRRNFMKLYAVFSSPQSYAVQLSSRQVLGSLSQGFVDRLVEGVLCFLLADDLGQCSACNTGTVGSSCRRHRAGASRPVVASFPSF